jgi:hypothetical protein
MMMGWRPDPLEHCRCLIRGACSGDRCRCRPIGRGSTGCGGETKGEDPVQRQLDQDRCRSEGKGDQGGQGRHAKHELGGGRPACRSVFASDVSALQAKKFVESLPKVLKENATKEEADKLKKALEAIGAEVTLD